METKIFISYNPKNQFEQSTALRVQTLASLYNLKIMLPDRLGTQTLKENTKQRILEAGAFVMFSNEILSQAVIDEVNFALKNKKLVIVFYDSRFKQKTAFHKLENRKNFFNIPFDPTEATTEDILQEVIEVLDQSKDDIEENNLLFTIISVGLGLFLLNSLTKK